MLSDNDEAIWGELQEFVELPTPSPFSRAFYQLMAEYATLSINSEASRELLAKFLSREVRYHRQIERLTGEGDIDIGHVQSLAGKRSIALRDLIEQAHRVDAQTPEGEIARQLVLAECHYHMQQSDRVVAHLERAVEDGAEDPLVYFALGYNRYRLALESFGTAPGDPGKAPLTDYLSFQMVCLQAVSAFENALTGEDSDEDIYHWIGRVLQAAGFDEAAAQAFDKAQGTDYYQADSSYQLPDQYSHRDLLVHGRGPGLLPPITETEIEQVRGQLKQSHDISKLGPGHSTASSN